MISVNKQVDYALQFILALAHLQDGEKLSIRSFAESRKLSFLFLQKVVGYLKKADLVESTQGARGGYRLAKPSEQISLQDLVVAVEGRRMPENQLACSSCQSKPGCESKAILSRVHSDVGQVLQRYTVESMLNTVSAQTAYRLAR